MSPSVYRPLHRTILSLVGAFAIAGGVAAAGCSSDPAVGVGQESDAGVSADALASPDATAADPATTPDARAADPEASSGCSADKVSYPAGATTEATLTSGSGARTFRVHVPPSYQKGKPLPVVLMLHGGGGSGAQLENDSARMDPIADREGFITVYPDGAGLIRTWNAGICCGKAAMDKVDDVAFIGSVLDDVEGKLCTDKRRVFSTGMSNGALMSHRLACELSTRIAAIAPVAGTIGVSTCQPSRPVPVLEIHGSKDGHVPWLGGHGCGPSDNVSFTSVPDTIDGWRGRDTCGEGSVASFSQGDGSCVTYQGCKAPVVLCTIAEGGHSWPGGQPKAPVSDCPGDGIQSSTFNASEAIWKFFSENPIAR